ncbi:CGNR zinc finger domain-containing protein [Nocardiopsis ansamitocini]|uniref:Zinc finger CGNR domain-containing protein n=1 Tax=Nocardiopsis ansamitocini TaxID=1670832 RepID=A0A9W6P2U4_9ACTN|nr:CGNR zinc finger domain-containing protein [Nocardiopsis ansamitocini]GLU46229.1 hypothetical protein Nans01_05800 [Nocardiopsis ansamitocini]
MQFNTYGGVGAFLSAQLLNSTDRRASALSVILAAHGISNPVIDDEQAERLALWTERLRPVFGEQDLQHQITVVNELLADTATGVRVSTHDGGTTPHLHYVSQELETVQRVSATMAGALAVAVCGAGGNRLGCCVREGCELVFVDTSRNGRRRFCSVSCANRVNVAAHRARLR